MSKSTITGTVNGVSDYSKNGYFNIALDDAEQKDNWYIGDGSTRDFVDGGLEKGDDVRVTVDDNKGGITDIEVVGKNVSGGGSEGGQNSNSAASSGAGDQAGARGDSDSGESSTDNFYLPKSKRIMLQVAFKKAVDKSDADAVESQGRHLDEVSELTNGYYNLLEAQVKDKSGGGQ